VDDHVDEVSWINENELQTAILSLSMDIFELNYVKEERLAQLEIIPCWHRLRKMNLEGDCPNDKCISYHRFIVD